ncbi:IS66 family transposase [Microcystis aeruginosa]|uniref:IS66 family transposase n=1 Tax=Microcystis aeruginosa TaxID=1126 RepID=UPI0035DFF119
MWNISGQGFSLFHAGDTRSRQELEHLLGKSFAGVLISDDFSTYNGYGAAAQQKCLAHLLRHFKQVEKLKIPLSITPCIRLSLLSPLLIFLSLSTPRPEYLPQKQQKKCKN